MMKTTTRWMAQLAAMALMLAWVPGAQAFYDPGAQRWINRDPIGEPVFEVQTSGRQLAHWRPSGDQDVATKSKRDGLIANMSLYGFVFNNPQNRFDPLGCGIAPLGQNTCVSILPIPHSRRRSCFPTL